MHRLAVVQRFGLGEALQVPLDQFGQAQDHPAAPFASERHPTGKGVHGGVDRVLHIGGVGIGQVRVHGAGGRGMHVQPGIARRGLQPAVDQVQDAFHGRPRRYPGPFIKDRWFVKPGSLLPSARSSIGTSRRDAFFVQLHVPAGPGPARDAGGTDPHGGGARPGDRCRHGIGPAGCHGDAGRDGSRGGNVHRQCRPFPPGRPGGLPYPARAVRGLRHGGGARPLVARRQGRRAAGGPGSFVRGA